MDKDHWLNHLTRTQDEVPDYAYIEYMDKTTIRYNRHTDRYSQVSKLDLMKILGNLDIPPDSEIQSIIIKNRSCAVHYWEGQQLKTISFKKSPKGEVLTKSIKIGIMRKLRRIYERTKR